MRGKPSLPRPRKFQDRVLTQVNAASILPPSMLLRSAQFRSFVAILLMVAIPFCCCNFRSLFAGDLECLTASVSEARLLRASLSPAEDRRPPANGCCHGKSVTESGTSEPEPQGDSSDQPRDCSCDKSGGKMLSVEKSALELSAQVVVAALEWAQWPELRPLDPVSGRGHLPPAAHRPLTSLVRMHCALIV